MLPPSSDSHSLLSLSKKMVKVKETKLRHGTNNDTELGEVRAGSVNSDEIKPLVTEDFSEFHISGDNLIPVVAHIPHSGLRIPEEFSSMFLISDDEIQEQKNLMTDWATNDIYSPVVQQGGTSLTLDISRLVMDPERYDDPEQEPMTAQGMGIIYTHGSHRQVIKSEPSQDERQMIMDNIYYPYHRELDRLVEQARAKHGYCLLLDGHSYYSESLPYELESTVSRPDICLGVVNDVHSPTALVSMMKYVFESEGFKVGLNEPFTGSILPGGLKDLRNVYSVMIEINRSTYMDDSFNLQPERVRVLQKAVESIVIASKSILAENINNTF